MGRHRSRPLLCAFASIASAAFLGSVGSAAADHPDSGLRVVRPSVGPPLLTHGPDPRPADAASRPLARAAFGAGLAGRPPLCTGSDHVRVLYARPAGTRNRLRRSRATIRGAILRTNAVLNAESLASGGPTADYRVHCDPDGRIGVDGVITNGSSFAEIVSAARAAGYNAPSDDYMIFFDGGGGASCGTASTYADDRLSASNDANGGGGYAVAYAGCWTEETPMHEIAHMMGAVQYSAPHSTGTGGHCYEENDVLCYSPDGGDLNQYGTVTSCAGVARFDCNFDDYFDSAPEPGEYLAEHWNLGSPLNGFIAFGGGAQGGGFGDAVVAAVENLLEGGKTSASGSGFAGADGEWRLYEIDVTGGAKQLVVRIGDAASGALTLYLRSRHAPTTLQYACKAAVHATTATCRIPRPRGGPWIAGVRSGPGAEGAAYKLRARLIR